MLIESLDILLCIRRPFSSAQVKEEPDVVAWQPPSVRQLQRAPAAGQESEHGPAQPAQCA
jgi:hypothetical protein